MSKILDKSYSKQVLSKTSMWEHKFTKSLKPYVSSCLASLRALACWMRCSMVVGIGKSEMDFICESSLTLLLWASCWRSLMISASKTRPDLNRLQDCLTLYKNLEKVGNVQVVGHQCSLLLYFNCEMGLRAALFNPCTIIQLLNAVLGSQIISRPGNLKRAWHLACMG